MARPDPKDVTAVACVGTGVIGAAWAAYFLAHGYDVTAWDPGEDAEAKLRRAVDAAWPALTDLGLAPGGARERLTFAPTLAEAVAGAPFIQESVPERLDIKIETIAAIDRAADPEAVISSSTSGISMTDMQVDCAHPDRTVVGHPFNPVYLIPLVEVVPGAKTDADAADWAKAFYDCAGKAAIVCKDGIPGFLANVVQDAMWMQALHMVQRGETTVEDLDKAVIDGPGLRWAMTGPFFTFHLGGGAGGMRHNLAQFGPGLEHPYSLIPPMTRDQATEDAVSDACERMAGGRGYEELVGARDKCLVAILKAVREWRATFD